MSVHEPDQIDAHMPEQILLGAMLSNGAVREGALRLCRLDDFTDAFHGRIFRNIGELRELGHIVTTLRVQSRMSKDPAWNKLPADYLENLVDAGRGQTDIRPLIDAMRDYRDDPKVALDEMAAKIEARP